jgi:hypothetical protein
MRSRRWELNPRPTVYDTAALPLSYVGNGILAVRQSEIVTSVSLKRDCKMGSNDIITRLPIPGGEMVSQQPLKLFF